MKKKLSIIMAAYNEAKTVKSVIEHTKKADIGDYNKEIIVVDDGSTDGTTGIIKEISGIKKIILTSNRGKGGALKEGMRHATGDYVIFHDADGEYDPSDFKYMLPLMESGLVGVVIGSRFLGRKQHWFGNKKNVIYLNLFGNIVLKTLWNILFFDNLTDIYPCYKLMRLKDLKELTIHADGFVFDLELLLKLKKEKKVFVEVPIHYRYRDYSEGKKIGIRDGLISVFYLLKYRLFND